MSFNSPPRVIYVDDDPEIVAAVEAHVRRQGWEFRSHGLIADALKEIRRQSPHVVVLDRRLPDGDGLDICRQMRSTGDLGEVPVIMATSRTDVQDRLDGFAAGAQDYVIKPFDPGELIARISVHLGGAIRTPARPSPEMERHLMERMNLDVVDMVMHDIRAPLATIKMLVDLMAAEPASARMKDDLLLIAKTSVDAALLMINDHLDLKLGRVEAHPGKIPIDDLLDRVRAVFQKQFDHDRITMKIDVPRGLTATTDGVLLFRILQNLISNARKYSPPGGAVTVRAQVSPRELTLEVQDQGPGIPDKDKPGLFSRERTAPSPDGRRGFGIGLRFCRLAVDALGGAIRVEDAPERGSRFIVSCPLR